MSERILDELTPPAGGWQRLVARRDEESQVRGFGVPLATAAVLAVVVFLVRPEVHELQLPWEGSRLIGQQSEGVGVRRVEGARVTPLASDDPRVHLYWLEARTGP